MLDQMLLDLPATTDRDQLREAINHLQVLSINEVAIAIPYFRLVPAYPRPTETSKKVRVMMNVCHWYAGDWGIGGPPGLMRLVDRLLRSAGFEPKGGAAPPGPHERVLQKHLRRRPRDGDMDV